MGRGAGPRSSPDPCERRGRVGTGAVDPASFAAGTGRNRRRSPCESCCRGGSQPQAWALRIPLQGRVATGPVVPANPAAGAGRAREPGPPGILTCRTAEVCPPKGYSGAPWGPPGGAVVVPAVGTYNYLGAEASIVSSVNDTATVLIVDDEQEVADVYALRLRDEYETRTAYGGEEALDVVDADVDVVLLDRRMPDRSGDEVLDEIRDQGLDTRVIMITAVDPDFDIIEMPFDDYLCKPVDKDDLVSAIEQQLNAREYDQTLTEYLEVTSKLALLQEEKSPTELEGNVEVEELQTRSEELKAEMDDSLAEFDDIDMAFRDIGRRSS
jgi:DNA-binding response OmpR family regulator